MNEDTLKTVIGIVPHWSLSNDEPPLIYLTDEIESDRMSFMSWSYPQFMLDALAAAAARMILEKKPNAAIIYKADTGETLEELARELRVLYGTDKN